MSAGLWRNSCPQQLCGMYLESALNFNVYLVTILECSSYKCDAVQISTTLSVRHVKRRVVRIFMGSHCRGYVDAQMVWCWVLNCKMLYQSKKKKKKLCCNKVLWSFNLLMRNLFIWYGTVWLHSIISAAHYVLCWSCASVRKYSSRF